MNLPRLPKYANNPLIAGLPPESISDDALLKLLSFPIDVPGEDIRRQPARIRLFLCEDLRRLQIVLDRDFELELEIATTIREGYVDRLPAPRYWRDHDKEVAAILAKVHADSPAFTNSRCIAVTGISGAGKTRSIDAALSMYPQVITHDTAKNPLLPLKQVVWLKLDFPSNRSPKALCKKFFKELGRVVGEPYETTFGGRNVDEMLSDMARLAREHFLGILVIDEIQHASGQSDKAPQALLRFIITMSNELKMPILLIGTTKALRELRQRLATIRRLIGLTYDRFEKADPQWVYFVSQLWEYHYTREAVEITDKLFDVFYDLTQGIPAFAISLFVLAQRREITRSANGEGADRLDVDSFTSVYRDYFKAVDPVIQALRAGDDLAIEQFEDLPSKFRLDAFIREQTETYLARELKGIDRAVGRAGKTMKTRIPALFQRFTAKLEERVEEKADSLDKSAKVMCGAAK